MFQTGEIVLYRLILARVSEILKENGSVRYLLTSLESDDCSYEVPAENRLGHLQALPDEAKIRTLFQDLASDPGVRIARNAVDRCCKAVLNQSPKQSEAMLNAALEAGTQEG